MNGKPLPKSKSNSQLSLASVLLSIAALSAWLAFGVAFEFSAKETFLLTTLLVLRLLIAFRSRPVVFSLPILVFILALPIVAEWDSIKSAWFRTKRPDPTSDWILWFFNYPVLPIATWFVDIRLNYDSLWSKIIRLAIELIVLCFWAVIINEICFDMRSGLR